MSPFSMGCKGERRAGLAFLLGIALVTLAAVPAHAVNGGTTRAVFCAHGFSLTNYDTFSFEPFEGKSDYNGLTEADWSQVRAAFTAAMAARGYRHVEQGGSLLLSCGAFPPIDLAHPVTGLFVKFRTGARLFDLTKWSTGAMVDAPYTAATLVTIVGLIAPQIPSRSGAVAAPALDLPANADFMPASAR